MSTSPPHESWARHYESVMHATFGPVYEDLTTCTLAQVDRMIGPDARVVDLGAGCGRLTIPLARSGRHVVAVERSPAMADMLAEAVRRLGREDRDAGDRVELRVAPMQAPGPLEPVDLVLCVFTVIAYCLTEPELDATFASAASVLRVGGALLLDVPDPEVFESLEVETGDLIRTVDMTAREGGRIGYHETTLIRTPEGPVRYEDAFDLRAWTVGEVRARLLATGFASVEDVSDAFPDLGARYLVARPG